VVFVLGHPAFYARFDFTVASRYGLRFQGNVPQEAFMVRELRQRALIGHTGVVQYHPEFKKV
jgi:putative acetyltransferase